MWPADWWMRYEHRIRKIAGLGVAPAESDPDRYAKRFAHCEVLIVGAGPAGLTAALGPVQALLVLRPVQATGDWWLVDYSLNYVISCELHG
jgi:hypothetical protein